MNKDNVRTSWDVSQQDILSLSLSLFQLSDRFYLKAEEHDEAPALLVC